MANQFLFPGGGDLEEYFASDYWLVDQYIGDQLWVWGTNYGSLGTNDTALKNTPVTTFAGGTTWKQVSAGASHTAAIKTDGTLWTWGSGYYGVIGNNQTSDRRTPVTTFGGGTNWRQVSAGRNQTAAIKTDGTLWVWGDCSRGALGNGIITGKRITPVTTFAGGSNWKQVSVMVSDISSPVFSVMGAIKTDGTLWVWGGNDQGGFGTGFLGTADTVDRSTPVTTFAGGNDWKQVSASTGMSAIKTDGTLWVWGTGTSGELGINAGGSKSTPVTTFAGGNNWKQVSRGRYSSAAIKTDGTLWTWGGGSAGRLGNAQITNRFTPVTTFAGGNNWKQVSVSGGTVAAIKTDGTLWVWGTNFGNLGINATGAKSTPVTTFAGGNDWKQVSDGSYTVRAVKSGINAEYPLS